MCIFIFILVIFFFDYIFFIRILFSDFVVVNGRRFIFVVVIRVVAVVFDWSIVVFLVVVCFIRFVVFGVKFEFVGIIIGVIDREIILVVLIGLSGYFFIVFFFLELIILIGVV